MTEIRDRIEGTISSMAQDFKDGFCTKEQLVQAILSRQELAIVDREAELPRMAVFVKHIEVIKEYKEMLHKEGWVKEVKK